MKPYFKNIEKDDFCRMLKFIMIWQDNIALVTTNSNLELFYPKCGAKFEVLVKPIEIKRKLYAELLLINNVGTNQLFDYRSTSHPTRMLSFLYHLRNAIAHGHIEREGDFYHIKDFRDKASTKPSAIGMVKKEIVHSIINIFIK